MASGTTDIGPTFGAAGGPPSGAAGGDLSGTYPNPTVATIGGAAVATAATASTIAKRGASGNLNWETATSVDPVADTPTIKEMLLLSRTGGSNTTGTNGRASAISIKDANNPTYVAMISGYRKDPNNDFLGGLKFYASTGAQASAATDLAECAGVSHLGYLVGLFGVAVMTAGAKPAASASYRGCLWVVQGGGGAADTLQVCLKATDDSYSWKDIVSG